MFDTLALASSSSMGVEQNPTVQLLQMVITLPILGGIFYFLFWLIRRRIRRRQAVPRDPAIWPSTPVLVLGGILALYGFSMGANPLSLAAVILTLTACIWWYVESRKLKRRESLVRRGIGYFLFFCGIGCIWGGAGAITLQLISGQSLPAIVWSIGTVVTLLIAVVLFLGAHYRVFRQPDEDTAAIKIQCPHCGIIDTAFKGSLVGKFVCPKCHKVFKGSEAGIAGDSNPSAPA